MKYNLRNRTTSPQATRRSLLLAAVTLGIALLTMGAETHAQVISTNYPNQGGAFGLYAPPATQAWQFRLYAQQFNTGSYSGLLGSVETVLRSSTSNSNVQATLWSDGAGNAPGTQIATLSTNLVAINPTPASNVFTPLSSVSLSPSTTYWVSFELLSGSGAGNIEIFASASVGFQNTAFKEGPGGTPATAPWQTFNNGNQVSLRVNGAGISAPEPATLSLLAMGLMGGVGLTRRRNKATKATKEN
jgi:PEP-CTERM motif